MGLGDRAGRGPGRGLAKLHVNDAAPLGLQGVGTLGLRLDTPELTVRVEAQPIPDTLEVTLFMDDGVDVDIHLLGGAAMDVTDMPFHEFHDPLLNNEDRDCYWGNCPVCSVSIPGQASVAVNPRQVDFDGDGALVTDKQDPQLDIDNVRGCFIGDSGERSCVPEKITVEQPAPGVYVVWPYLWGPPNTETAGLLSSPSTVSVNVDVQCRGVTLRVTRSLSSALTNGAAAPSTSPLRYAGNNGFILIDVPATGPCEILP